MSAGGNLRPFVRFLQSYGVWLGAGATALPIGASLLGLLPYYSSLKAQLSFGTSLIALLVIAALFAARNTIGHRVFPPLRYVSEEALIIRAILGLAIPLFLACTSILFMFFYIQTMNASVNNVGMKRAELSPSGQPLKAALQNNRSVRAYVDGNNELRVLASSKVNYAGTPGESVSKRIDYLTPKAYQQILKTTPPSVVAYGFWIRTWHGFMFTASVTSLVWFALIGYLQEQRGLSDEELIRVPYQLPNEEFFTVPKIVDKKTGHLIIFRRLNKDVRSETRGQGPYCPEHSNRTLNCLGKASAHGSGYIWQCSNEPNHELLISFSPERLRETMRQHL